MPGRVTFFVLKLLGHSAGLGLKYVPSLPSLIIEKLLGVTPHSLNDYQTIILSEVAVRSLPFILPQSIHGMAFLREVACWYRPKN